MAAGRRFEGWPRVAADLVERACDRHGGRARFDAARVINAEIFAMGGPLPWIKGQGRTYSPPARVRVFPHEQRTEFLDWPEPRGVGCFEGGSVRIEGGVGPSFAGVSHRQSVSPGRWRPADALYFFGYALANYLALPFLLADAEYIAHGRCSVTVRFAPGFDTHCPVQSFHFDETGLLERHDYTADVVGAWATGSHFSRDYVRVSGLSFACTRNVRVRLRSFVTPLPVLHARLGAFELG